MLWVCFLHCILCKSVCCTFLYVSLFYYVTFGGNSKELWLGGHLAYQLCKTPLRIAICHNQECSVLGSSSTSDGSSNVFCHHPNLSPGWPLSRFLSLSPSAFLPSTYHNQDIHQHMIKK